MDKGTSFKLRRQIVLARKNLQSAIDGITMHEYAYVLPPCEERQLKTCINEFDKTVDVVNETSGDGFAVFCENFLAGLPCRDKKCSYRKSNIAYIKAKTEYNNAVYNYDVYRFSKMLESAVKGK